MTLRHLAAATVFAVSSLFLAASAQAEELNPQVAERVGQLLDKTLLFRNDSDRIPQLEYLRPDGTGVVWSAALGDKVVPAAWTASNGEDGTGAFCLLFKGGDIGTAQDLRLCDRLEVIEGSIRDARDGDPYNLAGTVRMKAALPQDLGALAEVDRLLGPTP
ncbi:hypothetical protein [Pararhizobium sp.]|uniref:hypothetical protein n=1 Tax=Pararhizobium sp. TaxID=1977563 RepID=UPI002715E28D|nr:hypothetical protein [Pararhizobium sp.]MDO9418851.1 hypothetical protein [Pararhizobium sp.]